MEARLKNRVRQQREARGWTQEELAHRAGVSRQSINSIECQRYVPSLPLALMLARLFHCAVEKLFSLEAEA